MEHTKGELECGEDAALWIGDKKICTINWLMTLKRGDSIIIHEDETQANAGHLVRCWNSHDDLVDALKGDKEINVPIILSQALLGNYATVKTMLSELCSIHARAIRKAKKTIG